MQAQLKDITKGYDRKLASVHGGSINVPSWHMQLFLQEVAQASLLRQRVALAEIEMQAIENHFRATGQHDMAAEVVQARHRIKNNHWTMDQLQKQIIAQRSQERIPT